MESAENIWIYCLVDIGMLAARQKLDLTVPPSLQIKELVPFMADIRKSRTEDEAQKVFSENPEAARSFVKHALSLRHSFSPSPELRLIISQSKPADAYENVVRYITEKNTEPNQAPETTICTVTDRAPSSTLRASADRVSP
jgi:hypothetical protein